MDHHPKPTPLLDGSTLFIIFIAITAAVFLTYASALDSYTNSRNDPRMEYHATVDERIAPFGRVALPGDELAPDAVQVEAAPAAEPHETVRTGVQTFNEACIACHGSGVGGAPTLTDRSLWTDRIAQGTDTLYRNAIQGYTGSLGYMPPKGARMDLTDGEVTDAVDYMLSQLPE